MPPTHTLTHHICFALYSANLAMAALYKRLLDPLGLTYPQFITLVLLWSQDGQTVGALGRQLHLESNTMTPLLKRLETAGLVQRKRNGADERQVHVCLTDQGRALQAQAGDIPGYIMAATGLAATDLSDLTASVATLRDRLLTP
jgi:MarR family transcriptional regulator, organic hydroperoxide resistance regulator